MEKLKIYLSQTGLSLEEVSSVTNVFQLKKYAKEAHFTEESQICRYIGFIEKGMFQYFSYVDGEERTTYIVAEGSFVTSLASFVHQIPCKENIRCVLEAEVAIISYDSFRNLINTLPNFKEFYIQLLEYQINCIDNSRLDFIVLNAESRYEKMLREEPHLLQKIPLQFLASILGVTPRHLSRIRNKIQ